MKFGVKREDEFFFVKAFVFVIFLGKTELFKGVKWVGSVVRRLGKTPSDGQNRLYKASEQGCSQ